MQDAPVIPVLKWKLKLREAKSLAEKQATMNWENQVLTPTLSDSRLICHMR